MHLTKSKEARTVRNRESVEEESHLAISSGADSSPQIYALKSEASLNLGKHQEAYTIIQKGPNYDANLCIQFLGTTGCSDLLTTKAQVYMAAGRQWRLLNVQRNLIQPRRQKLQHRGLWKILYYYAIVIGTLVSKFFEIRLQRSGEPGNRGLHSKGFQKALTRRLQLQFWSPQFGVLHKSCSLLAYMQYHHVVGRGYTALKDANSHQVFDNN
ncbi:hypothetical protein DCAR_0728140 [Daucus carota subsp. sativus]|uniref:Uncharacterized protein n=1 Tax=Daucus carota subsp. sativus TaxID=79200 RepID=A0A161ZJM1_DAUCS|nr:hypothetical protein DCAR_0728140 [Daucus carota subsp. sativus]